MEKTKKESDSKTKKPKQVKQKIMNVEEYDIEPSYIIMHTGYEGKLNNLPEEEWRDWMNDYIKNYRDDFDSEGSDSSENADIIPKDRDTFLKKINVISIGGKLINDNDDHKLVNKYITY